MCGSLFAYLTLLKWAAYFSVMGAIVYVAHHFIIN